MCVAGMGPGDEQRERTMDKRRYGRWSGNPKGYPERVTDCVVAVGGGSAWGPANERQCSRKRGHGPDGLYCKAHASGLFPVPPVARKDGAL